MGKRIYKSYKIKVINDDGEKYIDFNKNIDTTSYNTVIKYYHMTKYKYQNEDCTVEMLGVYEDETIGSVIFSKTFSKEVVEDKEILKSTDEIVSDIKSLLELLDRKNEYHNSMRSAFDKKQDVLLHKIESVKFLDATKVNIVDEKLKIINELEEVRHNRRINKNEARKLQLVYSKANIQEIIDKFNQIKIPIDTKDYEYINGDLEEQMIKEIKYNSEKQRINLMKQIEGKYKKIINDEVRKVLICYNKAYYKSNN